jgi:hypothetical protein
VCGAVLLAFCYWSRCTWSSVMHVVHRLPCVLYAVALSAMLLLALQCGPAHSTSVRLTCQWMLCGLIETETEMLPLFGAIFLMAGFMSQRAVRLYRVLQSLVS